VCPTLPRPPTSADANRVFRKKLGLTRNCRSGATQLSPRSLRQVEQSRPRSVCDHPRLLRRALMGCSGSKPPVVQEMTFEDDGGLVPATRSTKRMFKIVCIGAAGVGKTALMQYWVKRRTASSEYKTTIGADFMAKTIVLPDRTEALLQVWDTAGQEKFASLGRAFFKVTALSLQQLT
jgi:hypothetical protein